MIVIKFIVGFLCVCLALYILAFSAFLQKAKLTLEETEASELVLVIMFIMWFMLLLISIKI